jgi:hypothetical protein
MQKSDPPPSHFIRDVTCTVLHNWNRDCRRSRGGAEERRHGWLVRAVETSELCALSARPFSTVRTMKRTVRTPLQNAQYSTESTVHYTPYPPLPWHRSNPHHIDSTPNSSTRPSLWHPPPSSSPLALPVSSPLLSASPFSPSNPSSTLHF